jgi:hypothetical protein
MPDLEASGEFESEHFNGSWTRVAPESSGQGDDARPFAAGDLVIDAKCKTCGDSARTELYQRSVAMRCDSCPHFESVSKELLGDSTCLGVVCLPASTSFRIIGGRTFFETRICRSCSNLVRAKVRVLDADGTLTLNRVASHYFHGCRRPITRSRLPRKQLRASPLAFACLRRRARLRHLLTGLSGRRGRGRGPCAFRASFELPAELLPPIQGLGGTWRK